MIVRKSENDEKSVHVSGFVLLMEGLGAICDSTRGGSTRISRQLAPVKFALARHSKRGEVEESTASSGSSRKRLTETGGDKEPNSNRDLSQYLDCCASRDAEDPYHVQSELEPPPAGQVPWVSDAARYGCEGNGREVWNHQISRHGERN